MTHYKNKYCAFVGMTEHLLEEKMLSNYHFTFPIDLQKHNDRDREFNKIFDSAFKDRIAYRASKRVSWRNWLLQEGFNRNYYEKCNKDFARAAKLSYQKNEAAFGKKSTHSFFGQLGEPVVDGKCYADYIIERWSASDKRSYPFFSFNISDTKWVYAELIKNKNQSRSLRTSVSCCLNLTFKWNSIRKIPVHIWMMRHVLWTHLYEEIFSSSDILAALCENIGITGEGEIGIFMSSATMDSAPTARLFLSEAKPRFGSGRLNRNGVLWKP